MKRLRAVLLCLATCACSSAQQASNQVAQQPSPQAAPIPAPATAAPQRPIRDFVKEFNEGAARNHVFVEAWIKCKIALAEGLAARTDETSESIIVASFAACSHQEQALVASLAQGRGSSPDRTRSVIERIRETSREQLTLRIIAARTRNRSLPPPRGDRVDL